MIDKIIEFSAVKVTPDGISVFDQLINPKITIPPVTTAIHGIKDEDVKDSPVLEDVINDVLEFLGELPIIAHNAKFDIGFIVFFLHNNKLKLPSNQVFCTVRLARSLFEAPENYKLGTLTKFFEVPLENHHRALDDAYASLRIFNQCLIKSQQSRKNKNLFHKGKLFRVHDFDKNNFEDLPPHLKELKKYCKNQQMIEIKYSGGSIKNKFRPVKPVSLLPMPNGNILYAHCLVSDLYKSFSLKKISDLKTLSAEEIQEISSRDLAKKS